MTFLHFLHNQLNANSSDNALHAFYAVVILELKYSLISYLYKHRYVYIDLVTNTNLMFIQIKMTAK